jgi:D-sedoheptulose 7-phosphate isomerase
MQGRSASQSTRVKETDMALMTYALEYIHAVKQALDRLPLDRLAVVAEILLKAYEHGSQIFVMGNGGSSATASHFVNDLAKGIILPGHRRFKAIGLSDNTPLLTAWANDSAYEDIFKEQLENFLQPYDVVIGISGSGNSANVLKAIAYANQHGAITIGFTGFEGGKLTGIAQHCIIVSSSHMERVEDVHMALTHLLKLYLRQTILENTRNGRRESVEVSEVLRRQVSV